MAHCRDKTIDNVNPGLWANENERSYQTHVFILQCCKGTYNVASFIVPLTTHTLQTHWWISLPTYLNLVLRSSPFPPPEREENKRALGRRLHISYLATCLQLEATTGNTSAVRSLCDKELAPEGWAIEEESLLSSQLSKPRENHSHTLPIMHFSEIYWS